MKMFSSGEDAFMLHGEEAAAFFLVRDALLGEKEVGEIASGKGVEKALEEATAQVLRDIRDGVAKQPDTYLRQAREELAKGIADWRIAAPIAGLVLQNVSSLSLGTVRFVPTGSPLALKLARGMKRIVWTSPSPDEVKTSACEIFQSPLGADTFPACAIVQVRAADGDLAMTVGLAAVNRATAALMIYRCATERPCTFGPIGIPAHVTTWLATASGISDRGSLTSSQTSRFGRQYPFVVNPIVRRQLLKLRWGRLHRIFLAGKDGTVWERVIASSSFWLGKGLMEQEDDPAGSFASFMTVLEMLLASKDGAERIGGTVAERFAFLTRIGAAHREALWKRIKKLYDTRSRILHDGLAEVPEEDLQDIRQFAMECFFTLLLRLPKIDSSEALVQYCNRRKFR